MVNEMKNRFKVNKPCTRALKFINFNKRYFLINCIIDSGSSLNLINMNCPIMHDNRVNIMNDRMNLSAAFGGSQTVLGFVHFRLQIGQKTPLIKFYVIKDAIFSAILGYPSIVDLGLRIEGENVFTKNNMLLGEESKNKIYTLSAKNNEKTLYVDFDNFYESEEIFLQSDKQTIPIFANKITVEPSDKHKIIHYVNIQRVMV